MKNDGQLFFKIEDYLAGKLPPEEVAAFERDIAADPELAETVEMQRLERESLEFMLEQNLRSKMEAWKTAPPPDEPRSAKPGGGFLRWIWVGLGAAALLVVAFYFIKNKNSNPATTPENPTPRQQSAPQKTPYTGPVAEAPYPIPPSQNQPAQSLKNQPAGQFAALARDAYAGTRTSWGTTIRGDADDRVDSIFAEAKKWMDDGKPQNALRALDKIKTRDDPIVAEQGLILKAHAHFQAGNFAQAAEIFAVVMQSGGNRDEAQWLLLVSLAGQLPSRRDEVQRVLNDILKQDFPDDPANNHPYLRQAKDLKRSLDTLLK